MFSMKALHDQAVALDRLLELVVLLNADMTESLTQQGLSVPRAHLAWVLHRGGPVTQRALADALGVTPRNVTGLVDGLVASGHVTREAHPSDRRATLVALTPDGTAALEAMAEGHQELAATLFEPMSAPELRAFADGLEQVTERLREAVGS